MSLRRSSSGATYVGLSSTNSSSLSVMLATISIEELCQDTDSWSAELAASTQSEDTDTIIWERAQQDRDAGNLEGWYAQAELDSL